jgi:hypothetical protein
LWVGLLAVLSAGGVLWYSANHSSETATRGVDRPDTATVKLAWDKSASDRVVGYRVVYGTQPGRYDRSMDVGAAVTATLTGLRGGDRYFIAVVALDAHGNQSPPSKEVEAIAR